MHTFVDASKEAYAACVFLRTVSSLGVKIQLIRAKTRVAPLKQVTIPRLELMGCCIGARLANSVRVALGIPDISTTFWSDSKVALHWIRQQGDWTVFVSNRVKEINTIVPSGCWRHVPSKANPSDILSRGTSPKKMLESLWWQGPSWLAEASDNWPIDELDILNPDIDVERRKVSLCNLNLPEESVPWYAVRFSDYHKIIRVVAWMYRFKNNSKAEKSTQKRGELSVQEIEHAEKVLILIVQKQYFPDVNSIPHLSTFKDEQGIVRVKTRITERIDSPYFISPVLLPDQCVFTKRLIEHYHTMNCHAGTQILLSILREKFWILRGRKTVRRIVNKCMRCQRFKSKSCNSDPVPLPHDRVKEAAIFEVVGVDLAGPLFIKRGDKVWIVLYTCAIYRAIHLELVTSLSTESFLLSLRRFVARRGRPRVIYSDNGTNFRGAYNDLSDIDWNKIRYFAETRRIIWKFNPPSAAWWGGWWERLVRVVKELLRRTLGKANLTLEELQTVLCDCEATINSRPLTYMSDDPEDMAAITPAMFLIENSTSVVPDLDYIDANNCRKRFRYRQKLQEELRTRFRTEYLGQFVQKQRKSESPTLKLGEIVLIGNDTQKRLQWPLAKVVQLLPGKDGKIRTVKLKTQNGVLTRPIQRVYQLELELPSNNFSDSHLQITDSNNLSDKQPTCRVPDPEPTEMSPTVLELDRPSVPGADKLSTPTLAKPPRASRFGRVIRMPERLNLMSLQGPVLSSCPATQRGEDVERVNSTLPSPWQANENAVDHKTHSGCGLSERLTV